MANGSPKVHVLVWDKSGETLDDHVKLECDFAVTPDGYVQFAMGTYLKGLPEQAVHVWVHVKDLARALTMAVEEPNVSIQSSGDLEKEWEALDQAKQTAT